MENIYAKVNKALDEGILGCKVQKIKRDADSNISISYILHAGIGKYYVSDRLTHIEYEIQVDIWTDYETSNHALVEKAIQLMRENGFGLVSIRPDMYEPNVNIVHKPIIFKYLEKL